MSYHIKRSDASVQSALRRLAAAQLDKALQAVGERGGNLHVGVHEARKRCKKVRGLIRLVRPAFDAYAGENAALRDAARRLSRLRDRTAMLETLDRLLERLDSRVDHGQAGPLREALERRRAGAAQAADLPDSLQDFRRDLADCRARVPGWSLDQQGFDAVRDGVAKTFGRARKAMSQARDSRHPDDLHDWRKRVKYHWYHARLLRAIWPRQMRCHVAAAGQLSDLLGDHHDLNEFLRVLRDRTLPVAARQALARPARDEMARLEARAFDLGARLLAEKPKALTRRWGAWWQQAREPAD